MKLKLLTLFVAALAFQAANAISLTEFVVNNSGSGSAEIDYEGLDDGPQSDIEVATGVYLSYNEFVLVQNITNASGAIPGPATEGDYLSILAGGEATIDFDSNRTSLSFMWGSIDSYNNVEFLLDEIQVAEFSGDVVVSDSLNTSNVTANGEQGANGSAFVKFDGSDEFDQVKFTSTDNSFEIDNTTPSIPSDTSGGEDVPDSGSTIILLALAGLGLRLVIRNK